MVASLAEAKSHNLTPDQFLRFDRDIAEAKREHEDTAMALARTKKAAKNGAVNLDAYAFIQKLRKLDGDEQKVVVRQIQQYIIWLDMPLGTQFSLIDAPKMPAPSAKAKKQHSLSVADEDGLKAGRDGEAATDNPHAPGTEEHVHWTSGHREGLRERATASRMTNTDDERPADTADATRKAGQGRGRATKVGAHMENARLHLGNGAPH